MGGICSGGDRIQRQSELQRALGPEGPDFAMQELSLSRSTLGPRSYRGLGFRV